MFAPRYFAPRYFARRYWPPSGVEAVVNPAPGNRTLVLGRDVRGFGVEFGNRSFTVPFDSRRFTT